MAGFDEYNDGADEAAENGTILDGSDFDDDLGDDDLGDEDDFDDGLPFGDDESEESEESDGEGEEDADTIKSLKEELAELKSRFSSFSNLPASERPLAKMQADIEQTQKLANLPDIDPDRFDFSRFDRDLADFGKQHPQVFKHINKLAAIHANLASVRTRSQLELQHKIHQAYDLAVDEVLAGGLKNYGVADDDADFGAWVDEYPFEQFVQENEELFRRIVEKHRGKPVGTELVQDCIRAYTRRYINNKKKQGKAAAAKAGSAVASRTRPAGSSGGKPSASSKAQDQFSANLEREIELAMGVHRKKPKRG